MRRFALGLILILLTLTFVVIVFSKHVALKLVVTQPLEAQAMSSGTSMDSMIVRADRLMNVLVVAADMAELRAILAHYRPLP